MKKDTLASLDEHFRVAACKVLHGFTIDPPFICLHQQVFVWDTTMLDIEPAALGQLSWGYLLLLYHFLALADVVLSRIILSQFWVTLPEFVGWHCWSPILLMNSKHDTDDTMFGWYCYMETYLRDVIPTRHQHLMIGAMVRRALAACAGSTISCFGCTSYAGKLWCTVTIMTRHWLCQSRFHLCNHCQQHQAESLKHMNWIGCLRFSSSILHKNKWHMFHHCCDVRPGSRSFVGSRWQQRLEFWCLYDTQAPINCRNKRIVMLAHGSFKKIWLSGCRASLCFSLCLCLPSVNQARWRTRAGQNKLIPSMAFTETVQVSEDTDSERLCLNSNCISILHIKSYKYIYI